MSRELDLRTSLVMNASPRRVFELASPVEDWPALLPHYRRVTVLSRDTQTKTVRMAARRGIIPVSWESLVQADPSHLSLRFLHTAGFTKGMDVEWELTSNGSGQTRVTIIHRVQPISSAFRRQIIRLFAGWMFIDPIARRTLNRFKELTESP